MAQPPCGADNFAMQQPIPPARWAALALLVAVASLLACPAAAHASGDAAGVQTSGQTDNGAAASSASASQAASQAASQPASHAAPGAAPVASTPAPAALRQTLPTRFYAPLAGTAPKRTGVLLIGGSEGQLLMADEIGPQLAAAGFASLGVRYHDGWSGSAKLTQIPIEQFLAAAQALRAQAGVAQVVVVGDSRGSEAAMLAGLAASQSPGFAPLHVPLHAPAPALGGVQAPLQEQLQASVQVQASGIAGVVGYVPSSHVWSGMVLRYPSMRRIRPIRPIDE